MVSKVVNWGFEIQMYTLLYIKQVTDKGLLYGTGSYTKCLVIPYNGKGPEKCIYSIYVFKKIINEQIVRN